MSPSFALYPGAPAHGMLFVEAFGQLSRDTGRTRSVAGEDLYIVFSSHADLMSWSRTRGRSSSSEIAGPRERPVLWWMHEAELTAGDATSRIGWAQVGLETGIEPATALPALIQCLVDALRRFGVVELSGLQVTASHLQPGTGSCAWDLVSGLNWFNTRPEARAEALLAFDKGLLRGRSDSEFVATLQRMGGGSFEFGPLVAVSQEDSIDVPSEAPIDVVLSPAERGVSLRLPEWSASAAAWALATVFDTARSSEPGIRDFAARLSRVR